MTEFEGALPVWMFAAFPALWMTACQFLAILGGWRALAANYASEGAFTGDKKFMTSGSFGRFWAMAANYSNILTVGGDIRGVYFGVFFLLRPGHAPLFIPYDNLRGEEKRFLFFVM